MTQTQLNQLFKKIKQCRICEHSLPHLPNPVIKGRASAQLLIIGQAPGIRVHKSGIPWDDPSGDRLRLWLGMDKESFYDESLVAIMPMGFCYPGTGKSGDLPPRKECAPLWHPSILSHLPNIKLTLLIGQYAQNYYLSDRKNLSERVKNFTLYLPQYLVLPHPSPRNNIWLSKNPWFEKDLLPVLKQRAQKIVNAQGS